MSDFTIQFLIFAIGVVCGRMLQGYLDGTVR